MRLAIIALSISVLCTAQARETTHNMRLHQSSDGFETTTTIENIFTNLNAGAVYNSATLDLDASLGPLISAIVTRNSNYDTAAEVYGAIEASISPSAEVIDGWSVGINPATGLMSISNNGVSWDEWTTANGQRTMVVILDFGDMLDFNGNRFVETNEELYFIDVIGGKFVAYAANPQVNWRAEESGYIGVKALLQFELYQPVVLSASVGLAAAATNTDDWVVYDTMKYPLFTQLAQQLQVFGGNPSTYPDVAALITAWTKGVDGEVDNGWTLSLADSGPTLETRHIDGIPNITYDVMSTGRTQVALVAIPHSQLEFNATSGYQPFALADVLAPSWDPGQYDAIIVRSDSPLLSARNHRSPRPPEWLEQAFVGTSASGLTSYATPGRYYVLLRPEDFAAWTSYEQQHGDLPQGGDANGNGRSNFLDYASGQDAAAVGLQAPVELSGATLTLRERINALDARPTAEFSQDLVEWFDLEEGVHYQLAGESVTGEMRTRVLELPPPVPTTQRFFRLRFE